MKASRVLALLMAISMLLSVTALAVSPEIQPRSCMHDMQIYSTNYFRNDGPEGHTYVNVVHEQCTRCGLHYMYETDKYTYPHNLTLPCSVCGYAG